ncbi:MAG: tRNA lysidine(34) synthetase TilS, partial [Candidatus Omnitrophica bacterium]|nr:tRNA lysidine(34) synthetase TilS [Candidatus Omnitrophota bacterium]
MEDLREQVRETMASAELLHRGDRVLVGVSGGPDSVALLSVLAGLKEELAVSLVIVHVDHQLRPDSACDAEFVGTLAQQLRLPVTIMTRNVFADTRQGGMSLEDRARRVRYDAFREAARQHTANRLALAHTADDQAETVVMRMIRGAGMTGLCAIPMSRSLGDGARPSDGVGSSRGRRTRDGAMVIRPLLHVWRRDVLAYLTRHQLPFR